MKQLFFSVRSFGDTPRARDEIAQVIQSRHRPGSVYDVNEFTALVKTAAHIADIMTMVLLLVSAITLAVSGVGIMNIMLATVRSRIREIGIRKAVGATYREIQLQFLAEAILISLSGGIVGTLLGLALPLSVRFLLPCLYDSYFAVVRGHFPIHRDAGRDSFRNPARHTRGANGPVESLKYE